MSLNNTTSDIPYGYCYCGCGQKTNLIRANDFAAGKIKGKPHKYIDGHQNRQYQHLEGPNPSGLCMCGCGQLTPIAKGTDIAQGRIKGKPVRFMPGHAARLIKYKTLEEHFWTFCKRGPENECWEWQGYCSSVGYGQLTIGGRKGRPIGAHRISYEIHFGPIPPGKMVCHHCDNRACCNPSHLFLGSAKDNVQDMLAKGRNAYSGNPGESHPGAKLNDESIRHIRALWKQGVSQSEIARKFNVAQTTISSIVHRKNWSHIP